MKNDSMFSEFLNKWPHAYLRIVTKIGTRHSGWLQLSSVNVDNVGDSILLDDDGVLSLISMRDIVSIERDVKNDKMRMPDIESS
ncbi:MAG: hypothetical protein WC455_12750 [Dehalococcoidia bacterium]|jgi:hypothetical protein